MSSPSTTDDARDADVDDARSVRSNDHWSLQVLRQLPDAVLIVAEREDDGWQVVAANDAAVHITGFSRSALLLEGPDLLRVSGARDEDLHAFADAVRAGERLERTVWLRRPDGTGYWALVDLAPLRWDGMRDRLWVAVIRDVSERVEQINRDEAQLQVERRARLALAIVARVSDLLQEVDSSDVLRAIAELLVRRVVVWSGFFVLGRNLEQVEGIPPRPLSPPRRRQLPDADDPVLELARSDQMRTVTLDRTVQPAAGTVTAELLDLLPPVVTAHPGAELLVLPVLGRQFTLGLLVALVPGGPAEALLPDLTGEADDEDAVAVLPDEVGTVLELVARRVGMAMDNAQLYAREHLLAETLQSAMLPEQADVEGLDVWTYYAPNAEHAQVGGDWYDVVNLDPDTVAIVIGDVVGHDVEAAAAMGQMRSVVRAYAQELVDPGTVLGRVDSLVTGMRIPRTTSLVYATLTRRGEEEWHLSYSRAGHLPPLLVRDGAVTILDGAGGSLVGFGTGVRQTATAEVLPGDVLVLYTDGLVERRDRGMKEGMESLAELCSTVRAPDAAGVGEELLQLADQPEDDVAVVVVRVPGGPAAEADASQIRRRRWRLPADPSAIKRARRAVRRTCEAWGVNASAAELVVSELMANAVMHGWGRVGLRLQSTSDGLRIEVEDANPSPPITREHRASRVGGFGMHIVDRLADWGWRPQGEGKVVWARLRGDAAIPTLVTGTPDPEPETP